MKMQQINRKAIDALKKWTAAVKNPFLTLRTSDTNRKETSVENPENSVKSREKRIYTNLDVYNYIQENDSLENPLHKQYQFVLEEIQGEGLEKPISKFTILELFAVPTSLGNSDLTKQFNEFHGLVMFESAFQRVMQNPDGSYSVYPELIETDSKEDLLKYYLFDLHMSIQDVIDHLESSITETKEKLKNAEFQDYYGDPKYLILRTNAILEAMYMLRDYAAIEDKELVSMEIVNLEMFLHSMLDTVGLEDKKETYELLNVFDYQLKITKEQYDFLRSNYEKVLECEKQLEGVSHKVWQDYATAHQGVFMHQLTRGIVESDKMGKICVNFYSDNADILTSYANTGYAYPMDIDSLFTMCEMDVGSWAITKEDFVERGFPERWQYDDTRIFYEYPHHTKLFPPQYIEYQILMRQAFAEGIIDNSNQKVKPLYCFYTEQATPEQIEAIQEIAAKQGLEVKPIKTNTCIYQTHK